MDQKIMEVRIAVERWLHRQPTTTQIQTKTGEITWSGQMMILLRAGPVTHMMHASGRVH